MSGLTKALLGLTKALVILAAFALCVVILWKIRYPTYAGGWGGALYHLTLRGDATTVDLGGGQFLFALLAYEHSQEPHSTGMIPLKLLRQKLPMKVTMIIGHPIHSNGFRRRGAGARSRYRKSFIHVSCSFATSRIRRRLNSSIRTI
jgi:hypothetical protein